jgi:hypothetical protein
LATLTVTTSVSYSSVLETKDMTGILLLETKEASRYTAGLIPKLSIANTIPSLEIR